MKYDVSFLNGSQRAVRGMPYTTFLFTAIDEWVEYNVEVSKTIKMSKSFHEGLSKEFGGYINRIVCLVGELYVEVVEEDRFIEIA